jgi:hypothetical protein
MSRSFLAKYVSPWTLKRDRGQQQRLAELRDRDGENCRRCRRPMSFDLPAGHEKGPKIERIGGTASGEAEALEELCLCHVRCNSAGEDLTDEVQDRLRRKAEAELLSQSRKSRRRRA